MSARSPRERRLLARIAGLASAMPRTGKTSMADRARKRWAGVSEQERRAHMREVAMKRWGSREE